MAIRAQQAPLLDPRTLRSPGGVPLVRVTGALQRVLVCMGRQLGMFQQFARHGTLTAAELAARTGQELPRVDAWLKAMVLLGQVEFESRTGRYALARDTRMEAS